MGPAVRRIIHRIDTIGRSPASSDEAHLPVRFLVWMGVLMSCGGLVWGALALAAGLWIPALVPIGYVVATLVNLTVLARTRRFGPARVVQLTMSMLLPFLFQWSVGGFVASGAVMLWAMPSMVGSLTYQNWRGPSVALLAFVALTVFSGLIDDRVAAGMAPVDARSTLFFVVNISAITSIVFGLTTYLDLRRRTDNAALKEASAVIGNLNVELTEASAAKSAFLANMSHELRTPLNAIIGYSEMIIDEEPSGPSSFDARQIRSAGAHLLALINDVLDLAKVEAGQMRPQLELVSLGSVVAEVVSTMGPLLQSRGNRIEVRVPDGLCATTDLRLLRQILLNLLGNATKFTEQGLVELELGRQGSVLSVIVSDSGIGMTDEQVARVCQPFQQADASTTRRYGGTGLGLHLVHEFAQLLGGSLSVRSEFGVGTQVTVTLHAVA